MMINWSHFSYTDNRISFERVSKLSTSTLSIILGIHLIVLQYFILIGEYWRTSAWEILTFWRPWHGQINFLHGLQESVVLPFLVTTASVVDFDRLPGVSLLDVTFI